MKTKRIAILLVALMLIVALEVVMMNRCTRGDEAARPTPTAEPSAAPDPSQTGDQAGAQAGLPGAASTATARPGFTSPPGPGNGAPTQPPATNAPAATQRPASTPAPTQPPAPTPEPTDVPPSSVGGTLSSGTFSSNTGTSLNMSVSWSATNLGDGRARLDITGTVNSYDLQVQALPVSISFGDYSTSVTGRSITASGGSLASNTLFTTSMEVSTDMAGTMTVTWQYNGEYSGSTLSEITASDYVNT